MNQALPIAVIDGKPITEIPKSLYLPPAAMRVMLDTFEGPLDLLHYLIKKNNMDILNIPMVELTKQYLAYVDKIVASELELVADYLLMSATLIEIKSRMLLPQKEQLADEEVEDPRAALVERLLVYSKIRGAANHLAQQDIYGRDFWHGKINKPSMAKVKPRISCRALLNALFNIQERKEAIAEISFTVDNFTLREAMAHVMLKFRQAKDWLFTKLVGSNHATKARIGTIFMAALQLAKDQLVSLKQINDKEIQIIVRDHTR